MKKEFSFYEFVGILIPGSVLLFGVNFVVLRGTKNQLFDITKIGETVAFLILSYAMGHLIQSFANIFEKIIWIIYGGMPTQWLTKKNRFKQNLFTEPLNKKIVEKIEIKYGTGIKDSGRLVYNLIFLQGKSSRIDIFSGNYSLYRGLSIAFLVLSILCAYQYNLNWRQTILSLIPFCLTTYRMIRFAKYYATETYRTFFNIQT